MVCSPLLVRRQRFFAPLALPLIFWATAGIGFVYCSAHYDDPEASILRPPGTVRQSLFRPPAVPLITTDPFMQIWLMGTDATESATKHWDSSPKEVMGYLRIDGFPFRFLGACSENTVLAKEECPPALQQLSVTVEPTSTIFEFESPGKEVHLSLEFLSTLFVDNHTLLSRPVFYVHHTIYSLDGKDHRVQLYFDATAQHCINTLDEEVVWKAWDSSERHAASEGRELGLQGVKIGAFKQPVLGMAADRMRINWGWLHLATLEEASVSAGSAAAMRQHFVANSTLPTMSSDTRMPRPASDDMPAVAAAFESSISTDKPQEFLVLLGYDDVRSVYYFGQEMQGLWTRSYSDGITHAMADAAAEFSILKDKAHRLAARLRSRLHSAGGIALEHIGVLAYRQALAATKLVWNPRTGSAWNFLKEISTNGDMNTVDVIFPASPFFLALDPTLLQLLLTPILEYANNATWHKFSDPYSPHQLGVYPIANDTASMQEPMPMENTGNMFLMLLGIFQQVHKRGTDKDKSGFLSWLYPQYWQLLTAWAEELDASLPYPAEQLCTDDFTGALANNTNLAAKGIIALEAFAKLCIHVQAWSSALRGSDAGIEREVAAFPILDCGRYSVAAHRHAKTWVSDAFEAHPLPHYKIAFHMDNSYSIKYNLLWQRLLQLDGPFPWDLVARPELQFYLRHLNHYGTPLDMRHAYVKLDWLAWAACLADDSDSAAFKQLFDPILYMANDTNSRVPLSDLFDTKTAKNTRENRKFIARPVVGAVYAKLLLVIAGQDPLSIDEF